MGLFPTIPCPRCGKTAPPPCGCPPLPPGPADPAPEPARVTLRREKRPGGREMIVLEGFPPRTDLEEMARDLKKRLGAGGTVKGRTIEIQGDRREAIEPFLRERGFLPKRAGG